MPFISNQTFSRVNKNLDKVINDIDGRLLEKALYVAATVGVGYASTMVPIDTSTLINSQYISSPSKANYGMSIVCGYTANYAVYVHDFKGSPSPSPRSNGNGLTWSPMGEPFFLLNGFQMHMNEVNDAFYRSMKI